MGPKCVQFRHVKLTQQSSLHDLNAWKRLRLNLGVARPHDDALSDLAVVRDELHQWGAANQVLFDAGKESFHVLHRRCPYGEDFRVLGCWFDCKLLMHSAARHVATEAGWRLRSLLRSRRFFTFPELMTLYKAQILSFVESSTPALYHASPSTLERIDRVQRRFLRELVLTEEEALCDYRLAPLCSRRDMAMLGALHKLNLGLGPSQLAELFPQLGLVAEPELRKRLRHWRPLHRRQLGTSATHTSSLTLKRSLFGLVHCYNALPQKAVDATSVKCFQRTLQRALCKLAAAHRPGWQTFYAGGWKRLPRTKLDELF